MTSWKVFVAQLLTIIAGKSQTRKWALDKGVGLLWPMVYTWVILGLDEPLFSHPFTQGLPPYVWGSPLTIQASSQQEHLKQIPRT